MTSDISFGHWVCICCGTCVHVPFCRSSKSYRGRLLFEGLPGFRTPLSRMTRLLLHGVCTQIMTCCYLQTWDQAWFGHRPCQYSMYLSAISHTSPVVCLNTSGVLETGCRGGILLRKSAWQTQETKRHEWDIEGGLARFMVFLCAVFLAPKSG